MQFKQPKDDDKYRWTNHVKMKMLYYGISESLVKRIVRVPKRIEYGVAPNTVAVMQAGPSYQLRRPKGSEPRTSNKVRASGEIWVMYQTIGGKLLASSLEGNKKSKKLVAISSKLEASRKRIISAWRYPGISKPGAAIPIPDEILTELESVLE